MVSTLFGHTHSPSVTNVSCQCLLLALGFTAKLWKPPLLFKPPFQHPFIVSIFLILTSFRLYCPFSVLHTYPNHIGLALCGIPTMCIGKTNTWRKIVGEPLMNKHSWNYQPLYQWTKYTKQCSIFYLSKNKSHTKDIPYSIIQRQLIELNTKDERSGRITSIMKTQLGFYFIFTFSLLIFFSS